MAEVKKYTWEDLKSAEAKSKDGLLMLLHGKVYAIAKFCDEHPGGDEVLFGEAGRDATEAFEDVGHSEEAREILEKYYVGEGPGEAAKAPAKSPRQAAGTSGESSGGFGYLLPLVPLVAYFAYKFYASQSE